MEIVLPIGNDNIKVEEIWRRKIPHIKGLSFMISNLHRKLIVVSQNLVHLYDIEKNFELIKEYPITFID